METGEVTKFFTLESKNKLWENPKWKEGERSDP